MKQINGCFESKMSGVSEKKSIVKSSNCMRMQKNFINRAQNKHLTQTKFQSKTLPYVCFVYTGANQF